MNSQEIEFPSDSGPVKNTRNSMSFQEYNEYLSTLKPSKEELRKVHNYGGMFYLPEKEWPADERE
ncbi:MAG: hypothetical protein ACLFQK_06940 [Fibrobacterota bacterium]